MKIIEKLIQKFTKRNYTIVLLRHGESEANKEPKIYANKYDHVIELTDKGKDQARKVGQDIKKIFKNKPLDVFVSSYKRTKQTWENVKIGLDRNNLTVEYDPRLREQEHTQWKDPAERLKRLQDAKEMGFFYRYKFAESSADVYERIVTFLDGLRINRKLFNHENDCLIVSHNITLKAILMRYYRIDDEFFTQIPDLDNCKAIVLETEDFDRARLNYELTQGNEKLKEFLKNFEHKV